MSHRFGWAMIVAAGMVLGAALGPQVFSTPAACAAQNTEQDEAELAEELKQIKAEVKAINTLLQSGTLRVVVVINP